MLWNNDTTLLISILFSGDSSNPKGQGEKRDDSGKLRYAGSKQRLDDDQSDCADDITRLCPEIPKGNNFALLVCLQEKAKVWFVVTVQLILNGHPLTHLKNYKFLMVPCLVQNMQNLVTNSLP